MKMMVHYRRHPHHPRCPRGPRGMVLITVMWIAIALSAVVLVLCREMQVEQLTARQHQSQAQADAAERGVEQYVMSIVEQELLTPGYKDQVSWQQCPLGDCYFWVLTPNLDDEHQPAFGITDEGGKLDINYATEDMLEQLPNLDSNIAAAMWDWHTPGETVTINQNSGAQGAKSDFYESTFGYHAKDANFETLDELRLVSGLTPSDEPAASFYLWGADSNHDYVIEDSEAAASNAGMNFDLTQRGIMPYITVYGYQATIGQVLFQNTATGVATSPTPGSNPSNTTSNSTLTGTVTETITTLTDTTVTTYTDSNNTITRTVKTVATGWPLTTVSGNNGIANATLNIITINNQQYCAVPQQLSDISSQVPIDVNNTATLSLLQQLLQQAVPNIATTVYNRTNSQITATTGRNATAAKPYVNIWDWIVDMVEYCGMTSTDLSSENTPSGEPLFNVLTCLYNGTDGNGVTITIDPSTGLDTTTNMPPVPVQNAKLNVNSVSPEALLCLPGDPNSYPYTSTAPVSGTSYTRPTPATQPANANSTTTTTTPAWEAAFSEDDVQNIIAYREQNIQGQQQDPLQIPNISWLLDAIDPSEYYQLVAAGGMLTGSSSVFSADIVTVTQDGRAFKRVRIVVDDSSGTPVIVYRQDMTDAGWPLDPSIRETLRNPNGAMGAQTSTPGRRLTFGR